MQAATLCLTLLDSASDMAPNTDEVSQRGGETRGREALAGRGEGEAGEGPRSTAQELCPATREETHHHSHERPQERLDHDRKLRVRRLRTALTSIAKEQPWRLPLELALLSLHCAQHCPVFPFARLDHSRSGPHDQKRVLTRKKMQPAGPERDRARLVPS